MSSSKKMLDSFERSKILEIYFLRIDGRSDSALAKNYGPLFAIEINEIKDYLLHLDSKDSMLQKFLHITETV